MHSTIVASLMYMQDPSTLMSLQVGMPQRRKPEPYRQERREFPEQKEFPRGARKGFQPQKPRGKPLQPRGIKFQSKFNTEQIDVLRKEGKCFPCGEPGHVATTCLDRHSTSKGKEPEKPQQPPRPRAAGIRDVLGRN